MRLSEEFAAKARDQYGAYRHCCTWGRKSEKAQFWMREFRYWNRLKRLSLALERRVAELEERLAFLRERGYDADEMAQKAREWCKCGHCHYQNGRWMEAVSSREDPKVRAGTMTYANGGECPRCGDPLGDPAKREPQFTKEAATDAEAAL